MTTGSGQSVRRSRFGEHDNPAEGVFLTPPIPFDKVVAFSNVGGAVEFASTVIAGLPVGDLQILGGVLHLDAFENTAQANLVDTFALTYSLGTTATADNSLATTEINLLTAKTAAAATGGVAPHQKQVLDGLNVAAGATTAAAGYLDNNDGSLEVNLNMTLPDANVSGAASIRVRGTLQLAYIGYGKNS